MARHVRWIALALALLGGAAQAGERQFVWQYPPDLGEPTVTVVGGQVTASVWPLGAVFFDTPGDRRCFILTATFPDGTVLAHVDTSECGAFVPLVVGP